MDRLFSLSRSSKIIVVAALATSLLLLSVALFYATGDKLISLVSNAITAVTGILVDSLIMFLRERKEDIKEIQQSISSFLSQSIPLVVNGRFIGEPLDAHLLDPKYAIKIAVFQKSGEHHAAYRVSAERVQFEFTCLINVYRMSIVTFFSIEYDEQTIKEVCENLLNSGFKLNFEKVLRSNGSGHMVVFLRKDFTDHSAEFVFSAREQHWIAGELREWCRTMLRKLKYEPDRLRVLPIPFSNVAEE